MDITLGRISGIVGEIVWGHNFRWFLPRFKHLGSILELLTTGFPLSTILEFFYSTQVDLNPC